MARRGIVIIKIIDGPTFSRIDKDGGENLYKATVTVAAVERPSVIEKPVMKEARTAEIFGRGKSVGQALGRLLVAIESAVDAETPEDDVNAKATGDVVTSRRSRLVH